MGGVWLVDQGRRLLKISGASSAARKLIGGQ